MLTGVLKPKTCSAPNCSKEFMPARPMQSVCGPVCARRKVNAAKAQERAETRAKKEEMKSQRKLIAEAQDAFNAFIRERDKDKGCFVCDAPFDFTEGSLGGVMDAGHVRSRGAAPHLRFNEDNCHGECKHCNASFGAKPHEIKEGAIRRIGAERFAALEADNRIHKFTRDELRGIRDEFRAKVKALKAEGERE